MRKLVPWTAIIALAGAAAGSGGATWYWLGAQRSQDGRAERAAYLPRPSHDAPGPGPEAIDEHDEHAGRVALSPEAIAQFEVKVVSAGGGRLETTLRLPGEIQPNADRVAHVVPRVIGLVRESRKTLGETVEVGEVIAVLESRELAEAKAADLAAQARLELAKANFNRVDQLVADKAAATKGLFEARQRLDEAQIEHRVAEVRLHALGLSEQEVANLPNENHSDFSRYEIKAPFAGTIVEKHLTLGEVVGSEHGVFVLADLSNVWAEITVYPQDAGRVRAGSRVRITAPGLGEKPLVAEVSLAMVSPVVREATRTGSARAVLANSQGLWKPGQFITAELLVDSAEVSLLVPDEAIQRIENESVVFVEQDGAFEKRPVRLGRSDGRSSEVLSGLKAGERYVASGAFILKAELAKGTGEHEH